MRSSRSTFKRQVRVPYGAPRSSAVVQPGSYAQSERQRRDFLRRQGQVNAVSRIVSKVFNTITGGHRGPAPLKPGDIIRDFPFFTQVSEVQYFSTHPLLLDDVFGFAHGARFKFGRGAWEGRIATVIGARAGMLWVVLDGDSVARVLPLPNPTIVTEVDSTKAVATTSTSAWVRQRLVAYYLLRIIDDDNQDGATETLGADAGGTQGIFTPTTLAEVAEEAQRLYTPQQREFLQRAPDLYVHLVDDDAAQHLLPMEDGSLPGSPITAGGASSPTSPSRDPGSSTALPSLYQQVVDERELAGSKVVLLAPRVVVSSGTIGWAGEGAVIADGGGVRQFNASMSASLVV